MSSNSNQCLGEGSYYETKSTELGTGPEPPTLRVRYIDADGEVQLINALDQVMRSFSHLNGDARPRAARWLADRYSFCPDPF
jgi:hypothetical protein